MTRHRFFFPKKKTGGLMIHTKLQKFLCKVVVANNFFHSKSKRLTSKQILIKCMKFERPHAVSVVPAQARGLHQTIRNIKQTLFCKILNICCAPLFVKLNLLLVKYSQFPSQTNFPFWANCCNGKVLMRCWITCTV